MLKEEVAKALNAQGSAKTAGPLWEEVFSAYERGGPDSVWSLLEKRVKSIRSSANAQGREMKEAAGAVSKKARSKKRRQLRWRHSSS